MLNILIHKKTHSVTPQKLVMYQQCKVIEATDANHHIYYLIFFKNQFINGVKASATGLKSFLHRAFTNGIILDGTNPLTLRLLRRQESFSFFPMDQLLKKLQQSYPPLETALIFSFFDSFTTEESSYHLLKDTYYHYRRNGQMLFAYQVLKIALQYAPDDHFFKDMIGNLQFKNYEPFYKEIKTILQKDPLFAELIGFDNLGNLENTALLLDLYQTQSRPLDELILRIFLLRQHFTDDNFTAINEMMKSFSTEEQCSILEAIRQINNHPVVQEKLLHKFIEAAKHDEIIDFMMNSTFLPEEKQLPSLLASFQKANQLLLARYFTSSNKRLLQIFKNDSRTLEKVITLFISAFLEERSFQEILIWLKPFREAKLHFPIEQKIKKMQELQDDPVRQAALGEIYLYFHQTEKAIECFKWEMELNPEDFTPVQRLIQVYKQTGNQAEAAVYQQLLMQMQKYGKK
ncbi:hypothetical protein J9303_13640 [Bacillaceae bacterium Marseille-Q3522]|nr:hypothetical protein [Bacillaceae bacterium Marseille-Q3522]